MFSCYPRRPGPSPSPSAPAAACARTTCSGVPSSTPTCSEYARGFAKHTFLIFFNLPARYSLPRRSPLPYSQVEQEHPLHHRRRLFRRPQRLRWPPQGQRAASLQERRGGHPPDPHALRRPPRCLQALSEIYSFETLLTFFSPAVYCPGCRRAGMASGTGRAVSSSFYGFAKPSRYLFSTGSKCDFLKGGGVGVLHNAVLVVVVDTRAALVVRRSVPSHILATSTDVELLSS